MSAITERGSLTLENLGHDPEVERDRHIPNIWPAPAAGNPSEGLCGFRYIARDLVWGPTPDLCFVCSALWDFGERPRGWSL